ncbi:dihydroxyacid dehydratase/phosphogluconate dehydratase [Bartonella japonica]|uniref:Dihydroxyacid dehydratase/phosphogluconate dehydratase n=1 Tax=Bartonella japonica TaxID=357761 RepID=A0ABV2FP21_9HYPH
MFDAALYLWVCDKIIPSLMIGMLTFGHLLRIFVPASPVIKAMIKSKNMSALSRK